MFTRILLTYLFSSALLLSAQEVSTLIPTQAGVGYEAISWNPDNGRIVSPDFTHNKVHEIFLDGTTSVLIDAIGQPLGGTWDQAGNYYVSEYQGVGKIWKVDPSGDISIIATNMGGPAGLLVDSAQQILYVADYDNSLIRRVYLNGDQPDILVQGQGLNGPDGISYAPNGDLIVNNFNDNKIFRVTTDGQISLFTTLFGSLNSGYLVRHQDSYYVAGFYSNQIWKVDSTGVATAWSGSSTPGNIDGPLADARFNRPNGMGISASGDSIVITDGNNTPRIRLITGVNDLTTSLNQPWTSHDFKLSIYPNPVSAFLNISYELEKTAQVNVSLYSLQGTKLFQVADSVQQAGIHQISWELPKTLPPGQYQCVLESGQWISVGAVIVQP